VPPAPPLTVVLALYASKEPPSLRPSCGTASGTVQSTSVA